MSLPEHDIAFLSQAVPDLKDYLLSEVLFWPLGGRSPTGEQYARLTLGSLLFSCKVVEAHLDAVEKGSELMLAIDQIKSQWQVAWEQKAAQELSARVRQWQNYMEEYAHSPGDNLANYLSDVRTRVYINLLWEETNMPAVSDGQIIAGLDTRLRRLFKRGPFVWDAALQPVFPSKPYWYLYGTLKT